MPQGRVQDGGHKLVAVKARPQLIFIGHASRCALMYKLAVLRCHQGGCGREL